MSLSDLIRSRGRPIPIDDLLTDEDYAVMAQDDTTAKVPTPPPSDEPYGVATSVTPSGIELYYQSGPERLYRIRGPVGLSEGMWEYGEWAEVPSVSTVSDSLPKFLDSWGCKMGIDGLGQLWDEGHRLDVEHVFDAFGGEARIDAGMALLKSHKLTPYYRKGEAGTRGTNVHKALESWVESGATPDPRFYPETERGYVKGLVAFINDAHPHPLASELMVGSMVHGYAGRFDLLANLDFAGEVVVKSYKRRTPIRKQLSGVWFLDAKTSKDIYPSHKVQLRGYAEGYVECGYGDYPDHMGVIHLFPDGRYELIETDATYAEFLHVLDVYHVLQRLG